MSKIFQDEYLLLKVLWPKRLQPSRCKEKLNLGAFYDQALYWLDSFQPFQGYLNGIGKIYNRKVYLESATFRPSLPAGSLDLWTGQDPEKPDSAGTYLRIVWNANATWVCLKEHNGPNRNATMRRLYDYVGSGCQQFLALFSNVKGF